MPTAILYGRKPDDSAMPDPIKTDGNGHLMVSSTTGGTGTVQGEGTAGAPSGGVLTVQGDPAGTPIPASVSNRALYWPETGTPLAAAAAFNGASRDIGAASPGPVAYDYFNAMIYADQTGTATIQRSNDNAAWTPAATAPIVASTPLTLQVPLTARYHRIVVENGGTPQTVLSVNSSYTAA